jgi:hypothetical protein
MYGIHLDRTAQVNGYFLQVFQSADQLVQRIFVVLIQHKPETAFVLMLAKEDDGSHEVRIFQKGISDQ